MDSEAQLVDRAIAALSRRRGFKKGEREFEVRSLFPVSAWRPVSEPWWKKKEACVIGEDSCGNLYLRVCDGTVRFWDHETEEDEVLAPSVRQEKPNKVPDHECRSVCTSFQNEAAGLFRNGHRHPYHRWRDDVIFGRSSVAGAAHGGRVRCIFRSRRRRDELGHGRKKMRCAGRACWNSPARATDAGTAIHGCSDCIVSAPAVAWFADVEMKQTPDQSPEPTRLRGLRFSAADLRSTVGCQPKKTVGPLQGEAEL